MGILAGNIHRGELTERIKCVFERAKVNPTGVPVGMPDSEVTMFAKHTFERGNATEEITGGREMAANWHNFFVHYNHGAIINEKWFVEYNGQKYDIEQILEIGYREYKQLRCRLRD